MPQGINSTAIAFKQNLGQEYKQITAKPSVVAPVKRLRRSNAAPKMLH